jgi:DNA polymerase III delta prime subunit
MSTPHAVTFSKATKKQARARVAFCGPSGTGKTFTALSVARGLVGPEGRIALIDSEHGSAAKYADLFDFDHCILTSFSPDRYVEAIHVAEEGGYDAIVLDSLSHAWMGKDGALEQVDAAADRSRSGNKFVAWREVTPKHQALVEAILQSACHVFATMRSKTEYILEKDEKGNSVPRKIGMAPVQRDGIEFEFDVVGDLDLRHKLLVTKSRCPELADQVIEKPGARFGERLRAWLTDGAPATPPSPEVVIGGRTYRTAGITAADVQVVRDLSAALDALRGEGAGRALMLATVQKDRLVMLTAPEGTSVIGALRAAITGVTGTPPVAGSTPTPAPDETPTGSGMITLGQRGTLLEACCESGLGYETLKEYLGREHGIAAVSDIPVALYPTVEAWIRAAAATRPEAAGSSAA